MSRWPPMAAMATAAAALLPLLVGPPIPTSLGSELRTTYGTATTVCSLTDRRLAEVSGGVATDVGYVVQTDKSLNFLTLDGACKVADAAAFASKKSVDTEDLARGPDGTLWLADTGGNRITRSSVRMVGRRPDGRRVTVVLRLPAGPVDIEAVIVSNSSNVVMVTKASDGKSHVYWAPMPTSLGQESFASLTDVGVLDVRALNDLTDGQRSPLVTGAALSPDGSHVALRTYTDVFEYDVGSTAIPRQLVAETPRWVGQVTQPQGEAVLYTRDGSAFVLFSEQRNSPVLRIDITRTLRSTGAVAAVPSWYSLALLPPAALAGIGGVILGLRATGRRRHRRASTAEEAQP